MAIIPFLWGSHMCGSDLAKPGTAFLCIYLDPWRYPVIFPDYSIIMQVVIEF